MITKKNKQWTLCLLTAALAASNTMAENNSSTSLTGSHFLQQEDSALLPITIYTREDILQSGESNAADFIRKIPMNIHGSFRPISGSSAQTNANISLLGIGSYRTLVLLDGRRLGKSPTSGRAEDLNMIPMGAIERIEVLMDGASSIYGADTLAGVINVITRNEFQGVEIMLGGAEASIPTQGGEREEGSVVFGSSNERSSLLAGVSWNDREIILDRNLPWTLTEASIYSNNYTTIYNSYDVGDYRAIPGGCDYPDSGFQLSQFGNLCYYNYELESADEASIENKSFYVRAHHKLNDSWRLSAQTALRQTESYGQFAPVPGSSIFSEYFLSVDSPNNPTNPNSPLYDPDYGFDPVQVNWWHRFDALGNRETTVSSQQQDFRLDLDGQWLGADVNFGLRHLDNRSTDVGRNYVLLSAAAALIESGAYNLANPYGASDSVLNSIRTTIYRDAKYDINEYYASAQFSWLDLPAGKIATHVGIEYREEKYADIYDPQSEAGQILGSAGNSAGMNRDVKSALIETLIPLHQKLDLRLVARNDDYSDKGDALTSNITLAFSPLDNLTLRLAYSDNSRAPNLDLISQKPFVGILTVRDPQTCINQGFDPGCSVSIRNITYGNPFLDSEHSKQKAFGIDYHLNDWFQVSLDAYDLSVTNRIRAFTTQFLITAELNGDSLPLGLGCFRAPTGAITQCLTGYGNGGQIDILGANLDIEFNYDLLSGQMQNRLTLAYLDQLKTESSQNLVADPGSPQSRATLNNAYKLGNWSFVHNVNFIDKQDADSQFEAVGSWVTHDLQINYQTPWQGQFTVGAQNIGEKLPPIRQGFISRQAYNFELFNGDGRVVYARYTQSF